jgi:integrase
VFTSRDENGCRCKPTYQAQVWSAKDNKPIKKTFPTLAAARSWRSDAAVAVRQGALRAASPVTLNEAADAWLEGARAGTIRNRKGQVYKPSVIRSYDASLRLHVRDVLGAAKLSAITRFDIQDLADRLLADRRDPSTIRNTLMPLRVIYRRAVSRGDVTVNPTTALELPAVEGKRDRIATPKEAAQLVAALPTVADRALWSTALYAGLRRGEIMALRWEDVDLKARVLRVERSWDPIAGEFVATKSKAGRRTVPIASALKTVLLEHRLCSGRAGGLVFGRDAAHPYNDWVMQDRARRAWKKAKLAPIGLHEARHTFASLMIAAGVNAKALTTYLGHSSVSITYDRYGHLMPGNEGEAAELLDTYLTRETASNARSRTRSP